MRRKMILIIVFVVFLTSLPLFAQVFEVQQYLPFGEGREWNYQTKKTREYVLPNRRVSEEITGTLVESSSGATNVASIEIPVFIIKTQISETSQRTGKVNSGLLETYISSEPDQILIQAQKIQGVPSIEDKLERYNPPVALLKLPLPEEGKPYPSILKNNGMIIDSRPYAKSIESIDTPAGKFSECLRISTRGPISGTLAGPQPMLINEGSIEEILWFAKGVGLVKQVQVMRMRLDMGNGQLIETKEGKTRLLTTYKK